MNNHGKYEVVEKFDVCFNKYPYPVIKSFTNRDEAYSYVSTINVVYNNGHEAGKDAAELEAYRNATKQTA